MLDIAPILHSPPAYEPLVLKDPYPSLYMRHQYSLPVIELVEVSPPTPRRLASVIQSTPSYFSSSAGSEDDDDDQFESTESEMDVEDDHQDDVESYCSSDMDRDEDQMPHSQQLVHKASSFQRCIKRILQWRELSYPIGNGDSDPSKQEFAEIDTRPPLSTFDEPQASKRTSSSSSSASRSSMVSTSSSFVDPSSFSLACRRYSKPSSITSAELEMHPCPACDAFFPTHESLRAHGLATGNEACCVAVEYAFEK